MSLTKEEAAEVEKIVQETIIKELPKLLGRSLVQVKDYLIKTIT
jgi:hypothetical protein